MCSKEDANNGTDTNITSPDPILDPNATWLYFNDSRSLSLFYPNNNRAEKKWIATKIDQAFTGQLSTATNYLDWSFENTGDTRFLQNGGNPGGKEVMRIFLKKFNKIPGTGSYKMDIDYNEGYFFYDVYASSGIKRDSTRRPGLNNSVLNISKMVFDRAIGTTLDRYKMSGTATFNIMYFQNGTTSTQDVHMLQCTFNNVTIDFGK
jgi:hypothetical protein